MQSCDRLGGHDAQDFERKVGIFVTLGPDGGCVDPSQCEGWREKKSALAVELTLNLTPRAEPPTNIWSRSKTTAIGFWKKQPKGPKQMNSLAVM